MDVDGRNNLKVARAKLGLVSNYNFGPPLFIMIPQNKQLTHFAVYHIFFCTVHTETLDHKKVHDDFGLSVKEISPIQGTYSIGPC